jgi:hypothetical protein
VTADAQGRFTLVLPPGPYTLTATHEGRSAVARETLDTRPPPEVVLELGSALQAGGRVLDDARQPVAGARLELRHPADFSQWREAVTDAEGRYSVGPLEPGPWRFKVEAPATRTWRTRTTRCRVVDARTSRPVGGGRLHVILADGVPSPGGLRTLRHMQRIQDDGTFELTQLTARPYTLELTEAHGYAPARVRLGAGQHEVTLRLEPLAAP